jgi:hypothetical protein
MQDTDIKDFSKLQLKTSKFLPSGENYENVLNIFTKKLSILFFFLNSLFIL